MLNLILGIVITVISTLVGKNVTDNYKRKFNLFSDMEILNNNFIVNLNYNKNNLNKFLKTIDEKSEVDKIVSRNLYPSYLSVDEKTFIENYFNEVGKHGYLSEKEFLNSSSEKIKEYKSKSKADAEKFSSLGEKVGFLFGVIFLILII